MTGLSEKIIALLSFKGMGKKRVTDFFNEIFDNKNHYNFEFQDLIDSKINYIQKLIDTGLLTRSKWDFEIRKARELINRSSDLGISTINFTDTQYPKELVVLHKKPLILYVKGNIELLTDKYKVAIIGTRNPSILAQKMALKITEKISKADFTVVSGLAIGCDSIAQEIASLVNGKTIALLAHGLDQPVYPKQNRELAEQIIQRGGVLVSEYPIGTKLRPSFLVERDEWQSGMSSGTLAIESSLSGGTRHASLKSIEQNRVLAVLDHLAFSPKNEQLKFSKNDPSIGLNVKLIEEKSAFPVFDLNSIEEFIKLLKDKTAAIEGEEYDIRKTFLSVEESEIRSSDEMITYEQLSMLD